MNRLDFLRSLGIGASIPIKDLVTITKPAPEFAPVIDGTIIGSFMDHPLALWNNDSKTWVVQLVKNVGFIVRGFNILYHPLTEIIIRPEELEKLVSTGVHSYYGGLGMPLGFETPPGFMRCFFADATEYYRPK